jgi:site-specific recombinase XerD
MQPIGWHVLLHTFASHLVMKGAPLKAVQQLLGHASIQTTMRYAHLSPGATRAAIDLLDDRHEEIHGTHVAFSQKPSRN